MKLFWEWHRYSQRSNIFSYIYNNSKVLDYIYYIILFFENETLYANKDKNIKKYIIDFYLNASDIAEPVVEYN